MGCGPRALGGYARVWVGSVGVWVADPSRFGVWGCYCEPTTHMAQSSYVVRGVCLAVLCVGDCRAHRATKPRELRDNK